MKEVNKNGLTEEEFLAQYKPGDYERPSVTTDAVILGIDKEINNGKEIPVLKVLLIKRKDHPYINKWALPGGFVGISEDIDSAVARELEEETGVKNVYMEQLKTYGKPGRDPRMRVISIAYIALLNCFDLKIKAGDDAADAKWFEVELFQDDFEDELKLKNESGDIECIYLFKNQKMTDYEYKDTLAFDHAQIIYDALIRIRNKVEYTDIAFHLMPEEFTLPELQSVYEVLLGKELYKANFRDKMKGKIQEAKKTKYNGPHRPSKIYKRK